jgi:hypothetical protein
MYSLLRLINFYYSRTDLICPDGPLNSVFYTRNAFSKNKYNLVSSQFQDYVYDRLTS